jgi:hypothetical protein
MTITGSLSASGAADGRDEKEAAMGASAWDYVVRYQADLAAALDALRRRVFDEGSYISPTSYGLVAPTSVEALCQEEYYWEFMGTYGTHSIIDVAQVVAADDEIRPARRQPPALTGHTSRARGALRAGVTSAAAVMDKSLPERLTRSDAAMRS